MGDGGGCGGKSQSADQGIWGDPGVGVAKRRGNLVQRGGRGDRSAAVWGGPVREDAGSAECAATDASDGYSDGRARPSFERAVPGGDYGDRRGDRERKARIGMVQWVVDSGHFAGREGDRFHGMGRTGGSVISGGLPEAGWICAGGAGTGDGGEIFAGRNDGGCRDSDQTAAGGAASDWNGREPALSRGRHCEPGACGLVSGWQTSFAGRSCRGATAADLCDGSGGGKATAFGSSGFQGNGCCQGWETNCRAECVGGSGGV